MGSVGVSKPDATKPMGTVGSVSICAVNVGKLLPNSFFADTWTYQSREANTTPVVYGWTVGTESAISWGSWSAAPSNLTTDTAYSGWGNLTGGGSVTINSTSWPKTYTGKNSTTCPLLNTMGTGMLDYTDSGSLQSASLTGSSTPVYGTDITQTLNYSQNNDHTAKGYRYKWSTSGAGSCRLQSSNNRSYTVSRTGSSTKPVTWTAYNNVVTGWTYKQMSHNISGLKISGSSWNNSVALPITTSNGPSVYLSGSSTATTLKYVANQSVDWDGCIEERQSFQNTNASTIGTSDWSPIPSTAYDTDFVTVPTSGNSATLWGPILNDATWMRYDSSGNKSLSNTTNASQVSQLSSISCPTEARKLQVWSTATALETYLSSLVATGSTYHDIGMVWGARFISPTGIFASENAATPSGQPIQRHIVFMTDGDTNTSTTNYSAYGITWWNRKQTSYAPSGTNTDDIVNARLTALCTAIKNQNITLWVVSYGGGTVASTETRLQNCATTPNAPGVANTHYFNATDTTTLIAKFQQIASEIADLRLIS